MMEKAFDNEMERLKEEAEEEERIKECRLERKGYFPPMSVEELSEVLSLTIKKDKINKVVTFFCYLSAYTEDSQFNIIFNAPSSAGKSYIALEVASLFPKEDVMARGYCSAKAFFHVRGEYSREKKALTVDLSRKILVFLDQPHSHLLEHMRPLFSHDKKEIHMQITDKTEKRGLRTKNLILLGYPSVVFCTAGLNLDEQEATRFLLLSPETTQEKIAEGVIEAVRKGADPEAYFARLNSNPERQLLLHRIAAVKEEGITCVKIPKPKIIAERFLATYKPWKPRHQRDVKRLMSLIQSHALLNLWHRLTTDDLRVIIASQEDIEAAFRIWDEIATSQELNLPPYVLRLHEEVILALYQIKQRGLRRNEILRFHVEVYGRPLSPQILGRDILPSLEKAGLIYQKTDPDDKRNKLIYPILPGEDKASEPEN